MPGYVIHLAVAEEYLRKHKNKGEEYEEFIKGVIYPDSIVPKSKTHYGKESSLSNVFEFLKVNKINNSFNRGYFLHLLTDYLFYNRYIDHTSKDIYNDYDILWLLYHIVIIYHCSSIVMVRYIFLLTILLYDLFIQYIILYC